MKNLAALLRKARDVLCSMLDVMLFPIQKFGWTVQRNRRNVSYAVY